MIYEKYIEIKNSEFDGKDLIPFFTFPFSPPAHIWVSVRTPPRVE